jgi:hypothetical protein
MKNSVLTMLAAPKKGKKISLNEFLGDSGKQRTISLLHKISFHSWPALGSWADEMDSLPNARMY